MFINNTEDILKRHKRNKYDPFHYWAEDYRHNNLKDLIDLWDLSEDERNELTCNLKILEGRIINFWIGRYLDPEAKKAKERFQSRRRELVAGRVPNGTRVCSWPHYTSREQLLCGLGADTRCTGNISKATQYRCATLGTKRLL